MRALEFIRDHVTFKLPYDFSYHMKTPHENLKVAHNRPKPFFLHSSPPHSPQLRIDFSYYEISGPDICSLICDGDSGGSLGSENTVKRWGCRPVDVHHTVIYRESLIDFYYFLGIE